METYFGNTLTTNLDSRNEDPWKHASDRGTHLACGSPTSHSINSIVDHPSNESNDTVQSTIGQFAVQPLICPRHRSKDLDFGWGNVITLGLTIIR